MQENYHHDDLRSELIEEGIRLLDAEGYEGFSLRKVAKACNVSHAAPYRHFQNKDELISAIGSEVGERFAKTIQAGVDKYPDDPRSQLREMGYSYIKFFVENPAYLRLLFLSDGIWWASNGPGNPGNRIGSADLGDDKSAFGIMYRTVARYRSEVHSDNSMGLEELVLYCWGLVHGISMLIARKQFGDQGDCLELARRMLWSKDFLV